MVIKAQIIQKWQNGREKLIMGETAKKITRPGLEVIKLEFILRLKIKFNDWLLVDWRPQAANHCALF